MNDFYIDSNLNLPYERELARRLVEEYFLDLATMPENAREEFFHGIREITAVALAHGNPYANEVGGKSL